MACRTNCAAVQVKSILDIDYQGARRRLFAAALQVRGCSMVVVRGQICYNSTKHPSLLSKGGTIHLPGAGVV